MKNRYHWVVIAVIRHRHRHRHGHRYGLRISMLSWNIACIAIKHPQDISCQDRYGCLPIQVTSSISSVDGEEESRKVKEGRVGHFRTYRYCNCEDNDEHYKVESSSVSSFWMPHLVALCLRTFKYQNNIYVGRKEVRMSWNQDERATKDILLR